MTEESTEESADKLKELTRSIELLGSYLDDIHKACMNNNKSDLSDHIIPIIECILQEKSYICKGNHIVDFLDIVVIPKLENILEIVYILEKIPWRANDDDIKVGDRIPPPPLILSISHFRIIYTVVEILWSWGIQSYLNLSLIHI